MTRSRNSGIRKLGSQRYQVFVELAPDAEGKRRREYHTVHGSLEEAKAERAALVADKARGALVGRSDQTLGNYLESWLEWKRVRVSERTYQRYCSLARSSIIPALGRLPLQQLTTQHLDDYYTRSLKERGQRRGATISPTTIHHRHVVLKMALKRAVEQGILIRNPADFAVPPRTKRAPLRVLDESEARRLEGLLGNDPEQYPAFLALRTGARLGEILALRWGDVDFASGSITIHNTLVEPMSSEPSHGDWFAFKEPKNGRTRRVDVGSSTLELLRNHRRAQNELRLKLGIAWCDLDLVFTTDDGRPLRPSAVSTRFRELAGDNGFEGLRFHDLRHSHATIMLKLGVAPHVVSQRLGHSTVAFTLDRYAHVLPGQQRAAVEAFEAAVARA